MLEQVGAEPGLALLRIEGVAVDRQRDFILIEPAHYEPVDMDGLRLTDPVAPTDRLTLEVRVPVWRWEDDSTIVLQVQPF